MNRLIAALFLVFLTASPALATLVHYYDENGQIHYVNTDYVQVPAKYMSQVAPQLPRKTASPTTRRVIIKQQLPPSSPEVMNTKTEKGVAVNVFVGPNCPKCGKLEGLLQAYGVSYARFDVRYSKYAKQTVANLGLPLPFTQIRDQIIQGANIEKIRNTIAQYKTDKASFRK